MPTLKELGELEVIKRIAPLLNTRDDVKVHLGDDAAVVATDGEYDLLLTSDPVVEGVHFLEDTSPRQVGHKGVGRSLSDIAAMGGEPQWLLCDVVAPPSLDISVLEEMYKGAVDLAKKYGAAILGGDTAAGKALEFHVFAVGRVPAGKAVRRAGAQPGDALFVTGTLGGSLSGKHLGFDPRVKEGQWLRANGFASSMIDLSDGLATDLRHVLKQSDVGAQLVIADLPISNEAKKANDGRTPVQHALSDGEDFELLFTVPEERESVFLQQWHDTFDLPCTRIGAINDQPHDILCIGSEEERSVLDTIAWEHFRI